MNIEQQALVDGLRVIRRRLCTRHAGNGEPCDCKYFSAVQLTEQNGCLEVYDAARIISMMTPAEYERISKRHMARC